MTTWSRRHRRSHRLHFYDKASDRLLSTVLPKNVCPAILPEDAQSLKIWPFRKNARNPTVLRTLTETPLLPTLLCVSQG